MRGEMPYLLSDGSELTVTQMMEKWDLTKNTVSHRLRKSREIEYLGRPNNIRTANKEWVLTDGSVWTVASLTEYLKCDPRTAASRLYSKRPRTPERILCPVRGSNKDVKWPAQIPKGRMYADEDGFWALFNKMGKLST